MDELPRLSRTHRKAAIQVATLAAYKVIESAFCLCGRPIFRCARRRGRGLPVHRGSLKMHSGPEEGVFVHRAPLNAPRTTEACFAHTNICSVPEKVVSGTEYHSRTVEACFEHRVPLKMRRVPQEGVFAHRTHIPYHRRPSPVPNATNTTQSHPAAQTTASSTPSLQPSASWKPYPHYGHPPHGNRPGQETTDLRKNLCDFFKKLRELSRSFFIFVPNKYRNTQCKLFTTNTTNSWNLPR